MDTVRMAIEQWKDRGRELNALYDRLTSLLKTAQIETTGDPLRDFEELQYKVYHLIDREENAHHVLDMMGVPRKINSGEETYTLAGRLRLLDDKGVRYA